TAPTSEGGLGAQPARLCGVWRELGSTLGDVRNRRGSAPTSRRAAALVLLAAATRARAVAGGAALAGRLHGLRVHLAVSAKQPERLLRLPRRMDGLQEICRKIQIFRLRFR